ENESGSGAEDAARPASPQPFRKLHTLQKRMATNRGAALAERHAPRNLALVEIDGDEVRVGWFDQRNGTERRPGLLRGPTGLPVGSIEDAVRCAEFAVVRVVDVHVGIGPVVLAHL